MFIASVVLILLIGGWMLLGGGASILGSNGGNVVAGTVYNDTTPVPDEEVTLINESNNQVLDSTTTDANGEFEFNTTGSSGPYTVRPESENYESRGDVNDGKTDIVFGKAPGIFSGILGSSNNADASDSGNGENSSDDVSTDGEPANETDSQSTEENVISHIQGNVTREGGNNDGIPEATVVVSKVVDGTNEEINETETDETGFYRMESVEVPLEEGESLEDVTLAFEYSADGYETQNEEKDLGDYTSPSDGFESDWSIPEQ
jgi:hypothetical protein